MAESGRRGGSDVFKLSTRLAALSGAVVSVLAVGSIASVALFGRWTHELGVRRAARLASIDLGDLRLAYSDQETGARGFVLAGDATFLQPYDHGRAVETATRGLLATRLSADPTDRARLDAIGAAAARWHTEGAEPSIAQRRSGALPDAQLVERGKSLFDELRASLDRLDGPLRERAQRADDETARIQRIALGGAGVTLAAALGGGALVLVLFRRWVTRPMAGIGAAARAIEELRDVSLAVDFLQRSLSDARDRAVRAYETLEQSAVLALHVRSELADQHGPAPAGWELASTMRSAEGYVAGDCYDIGLVSPTALYIVMIDVTGHGATAALHALKAKTQLRTAVRSGLAPGDAMSWLARHQGRDDEYLTAWISIVDTVTGACAYANAGHPPALLADGTTVVELGATGPLVGPFNATWSTERTQLGPGATLLVHTDGLTEATGTDRERLGEQRVRDRLVSIGGLGARATIEALNAMVDEYRGGPLADDLSMAVLHREADVPDAADAERAVATAGR
jgi:CHASE3 domain sensor protein